MAEECDCRGCCRYPHGRISVFASIFAVISYILGVNAIWNCQYAQAGNNYGVGLLSREDLTANDDWDCRAWESGLIDEFDSYWKAGRGLGITGQVIGGLSMITMIATACMSFQMVYFTVLKYCMALAGLLVILTLVALNSDICERISFGDGSSCEFHTGAGLAIGSSICYWITAVLIHKIPPAREDSRHADAVATPVPAPPPGSSAPPGTVTVTEKNYPDGTKKIIKTTVNADGSKTVEETTTAAIP